jgi:glycosyltransferase involved in cell wall biosynthesis
MLGIPVRVAVFRTDYLLGMGPGAMRQANGKRVLVVAFDPLTETMPGPAIRAWNLAERLSEEHEVVLAGTAGVTRSHPHMEVRAVSGPELGALAAAASAVIAPIGCVRRHPEVAAASTPLAIDLSIPTVLENLEAGQAAGSPRHWQAIAHQVAVTSEDLLRGDFFLCASERQRHLWMGGLSMAGRVNPSNCNEDPTLRQLIDVVPFGLPDAAPPEGGKASLQARFEAIGPGDPVLAWAGGVYSWLDPLSVVRAVAELRGEIPRLRLVFFGLLHPTPGIEKSPVVAELERLTDSLGLTGKNVFFNDSWVPYDERASWLAGADIGVSTHLDHIESRYAFRTRVLDYLWAGLPMVLSEGDTLSAEIAGAGLAEAVPAGDSKAIARAIRKLLASPPPREAVQAHAARYRWSEVARPLICWCRSPHPAADRSSVHHG